MEIAEQSKSFAWGVEAGLLQEPLDAVRQIAYHAGISKEKPGVGSSSPYDSQREKSTADSQTTDSLAFQAGKTVGKIAEFWLINRAVGAVSGIGQINALSTTGSEALKMGMSGAVSGMLTPVDDKNFASEKLAGIVSEGASFATFGAVQGRFSELGVLGRPGFRAFWQDATVNATAGALSGAVSADVHSVITTGKVASIEVIGSSMLQNAIMGAGFSALDHSLPRASVKIRPDADGIKGSALSSEDWAANVYDSSHGELKSPILTWLTEKNMVPKPQNYDQVKEALWAQKNTVELSLADWSPQQRPAVIQALRRIGHPDLGKDANIDAFLSKLTTSDATEKFNAFQAAPTSRNESAALSKNIFGTLSGIADDIGVPRLRSVNVYAGNSSMRIGDTLDLGLGKEPALNAMSADNIYHEFTHHTQGQFRDPETLIYVAKYPFYSAAKRLGIIDEIPTMQNAQNRKDYLNQYIGSTQEKEAWATGLLVRIRAVAAGMPNFQG